MSLDNYPPGVNYDDPRAPWNAEEPDQMTKEELLDWIYNALREDGFEPEYKGMRIRCQFMYVDVSDD